MNFDVRALTDLKRVETRHEGVDWLRALESARQSLKFIDIDYESLERLALASRSPHQFTVLSRLIYQYGRSHPQGAQIADLLFSLTNESSFSLADWLDAIQGFYDWLQKNGRKVDFLPMLEYLKCCSVSPDAREAGQTLGGLVEDMLRVCGYEG